MLARTHSVVAPERAEEVAGSCVAGVAGDVGDIVIGGFQSQDHRAKARLDQFQVDAVLEFLPKRPFEHPPAHPHRRRHVIERQGLLA